MVVLLILLLVASVWECALPSILHASFVLKQVSLFFNDRIQDMLSPKIWQIGSRKTAEHKQAMLWFLSTVLPEAAGKT